MPSCSISLLMKLKSVSRYCTQYSHSRYEPLSASSKSVSPCIRKTSLIRSGTVVFWKTRQSLVRVRNHSHGRSTAR